MTSENPASPPVLFAEARVTEQRGPWPFGLSIAWLCVLTGFMFGMQIAAALIPALVEIVVKLLRNQRPSLAGAMPLGTLVVWAQVACMIAVPPAVWFLAWLRGRGDTAAYVGLRGFRWSDLGLGALGLVVVGLAAQALVTENNEMMKQIYNTAEPTWMLWIAVAVMAPVVEELVFRGFVFEGLSTVNGGPWTASAITAAIWAGIHMQYGWREMIVLFLFGMVLGMVRYRSGSVWLCILLHAVNNAGSIVFLAGEIEKGGG